MTNLKDRIKVVSLFEVYGDLLTDLQKEILKDYYLYDLSLSEIAEERKISRAAVSDSLNKSLAKLEEFENKLKIISTKEKIDEVCEELNRSNDPKVKSLISKLKEF